VTVGLAKAGTRNRGLFARLSVCVCERRAAPRPTTLRIHSSPPSPSPSTYDSASSHIALITACARSIGRQPNVKADPPFSRFQAPAGAASPQKLAALDRRELPASRRLPACTLTTSSIISAKQPSFLRTQARTTHVRQNVCAIAAKAVGDEQRRDECLGRSVPPAIPYVRDNRD
jgi:hypothetical protein